ncbi:unnamed protein product [Rhizoctonia solani]|uniref:F-box domain-containing protein n=1 Tax=Rhizoctonia solani TaxID=456999 RepID=A0A8H3BQ30_9AGAM|nr:unnamed protein product [Rhizoctonia solani]CAE6491190.1 unnamed protein product [Rhizoctonia solani]
MPTTRSQARHSRLPATDHRVGINRLPPEVLSEVFVICDRTWSPFDGYWTVFAPQTAACRHWRKVAIDTTALWTRVTLLDRPPWDFSKLCLLRSGPTALLDIDINMNESFWVNTEEGTLHECVQRAKDAFAFIIKHGGVPSRWRSFAILIDTFLVQLATIDVLQQSVFPSLTSLEMQFTGPYEFDDEDEFELVEHIQSQPKLLFQEPPPQLRSVKLQGVPVPYLFGHRAHPQLVSLTHLELRFEGLYPRLTDLNKMLSANLNLESLRLNSETIGQPLQLELKILPQVRLPRLKALAFINVASQLWTLHAIKMLDAPNVTAFELILGTLSYESHREYAGIQTLIGHITGDVNQETPTPRFPALTSLTLASEMTLGFKHITAGVLAAYPGIKELRLPLCPSLSPLLQRPWLAPGLERLRVGVQNLVQLKKVVNSRCKAGLPLRTVLVDDLELTAKVKPSDRAQLRKYVEFTRVSDDGEPLDDN